MGEMRSIDVIASDTEVNENWGKYTFSCNTPGNINSPQINNMYGDKAILYDYSLYADDTNIE